MKIWAFAFLFLTGFISCSNADSATTTAEITQQEGVAVSLDNEDWESKKSAVPGKIIDVRTADEYSEGHIEGAVNMDVLESNFIDELNELSLNKSDAIYLYCRSGSRSKRAMSILQKEGFTQIYELDNGIMGWQDEGKPVVK